MSRALREARIGYGGYSADFRHPGDRRRFSAYAAQKDLAYEGARADGDYDLVLVTHNSDLTGWTRRKRQAGDRLKLVFELVDSYFVQRSPVRRFLKGATRYVRGPDSRLSPDFLKTLQRACEAADAVVCSTDEQRETILRYNSNVHLSFDYFGDDLGAPKQDYSRGEKLRLVWEGQAVTLPNLTRLTGPLNELRDRIELTVVTDPYWRRWVISGRGTPVLEKLRDLKCPVVFHPWERETFSDRIVACDLAIIPIDRDDPMARGKPENKLVLLWQLGMPVLTSSTPAYERAMAAAGLDLTCGDMSQWTERLERMIAAPAGELERIARQGRTCATTAYSKERFQAAFDATFESIGFDPA
jgi:hypothetical protein